MKTAQEAFIDLYNRQDKYYPGERKYDLACEQFKNIYNLMPPYMNWRSFKNVLYQRR